MKRTFKFFMTISIFANCFPSLKASVPLVIGHRGAPGYRPEHTLASYQLAIEQGADYIEPDLVITKDGVLIVRHENEISGTTDVESKFPDRKKIKKIDGKEVSGWFTEDFTLAEIKTLRAKERLPSRDHSFDFKFEVPTFFEVLSLVKQQSQKQNRKIGIYPETKHPSYFKGIGLSLVDPLVKALKESGFAAKNSLIFIQSFELSVLQELRKSLPVPLIFLLDAAEERPYDFILSGDSRTYGDLIRPEELSRLKKWVDGIGPWKRLILPENSEGKLQEASSLVADAHKVGLQVHPYTFRSDKEFLHTSYQDGPESEYHQFFSLGVDGVFSDFPDHAFKARESYLKNIKN